MMIRTVLERLSRKVVLRRRLPSRLGGDQLFVSPDSALRCWKRNLDSAWGDLFAFAEEFVNKGDVVWDVGANVGMLTFPCAFRAGSAGRVIAIEPDVFLVNLLRQSASNMSPERAAVVVLPVAVSNSIGIASFHIARRGRSTNYLASLPGSSEAGGVRETVSVITVTLDWLMEQLPKPNVLKIDVEGAEFNVLAGATRLLTEAKPVILCEVSRENEDACTEILRSHGYNLYDFDNRGRGRLEKAPFSTLAINEGRRAR